MPHSPELEHELEKSALVEKLAKRLQSLIVGSGIPLSEVVRMLRAEEFFAKVGKGKNVGNVFYFKEWAKKVVSEASEKRNEIDSTSISLEKISLKLPETAFQISETILPPGAGEIVGGSGKGIEKKEVFPRTLWLMELLSEMNLKYELKNGRNSKEMMRGLSYVEILIPDIKKVVFVNDEEGNATYVIHGVESEMELKNFRRMKKEELQEMRATGKVSYLEFNQEDGEVWKVELKEILEMKVGMDTVRKESNDEDNDGNKDDYNNKDESEGGEALDIGKEKMDLEIAPDGWMTARNLGINLQVNEEKIRSTANLLHDNKDKVGHEVFKDLDLKFNVNYKAKSGNPGFYFTPGQVDALTSELKPYSELKKRLKPVLEGEKTAAILASEISAISGFSTSREITRIKTAAILLHDDKDKPDHELFKDLDLEFNANRKAKSGNPGFYFTPDQIDALMKELKSNIEKENKLPIVLDGEKTAKNLVKEIYEKKGIWVNTSQIYSTSILLHDNLDKPGHNVFVDLDLKFRMNRRSKSGNHDFYFTPAQVEALLNELTK